MQQNTRIFILLALLGIVLAHGAPAIVIRVPWFIVWVVLAAIAAFGQPLVHLLGRQQDLPEQRFPEVYDTHSYHTAYMGATERLEEGE